MNKMSLLYTEQITTLEKLVEIGIQQISRLQLEVADAEHDQRDLIGNGNGTAPILEMEEARLLTVVNSDPANTNDARRKAALSQLKAQDPQYQRIAQDVANLRRLLEQRRIEITCEGYRLQAAMESLRCRRTMLNVLAEKD